MTQGKLEYLQKVLQTAISKVKNREIEDSFEFYSSVYEDWDEKENFFGEGDYRSSDEELACNAIKHTELHALMRELVQEITEYNNNTEEHLWDQDEEQAGGCIARELALVYKDDAVSFGRLLSSNDLNHEVYQAEDICDVLDKWGACKETYALVAARWYTPGQHRDEMDYDEISKAMSDKAEADAFLQMNAKWFIEKWFRHYNANNCAEDIHELFEMILQPALELSDEQIDSMTDKFVELVNKGKSPVLNDVLAD